MKVDAIVANLRALLRANSIIAEIHARHLVVRSSLTGFAALIGAFGLLMLGIGGFFWLETLYGPVIAALAVGVGNCVLAVILLLIASRLKPGRDLELAREVHRAAMDSLISDSRTVETEYQSFKQALRSPPESVLPGLAMQLASILIRVLNRRMDTPPKP